MGKLSTHQRRARNFVQRAEWDSALAEMRQAMGSDPNNPTTHNQMGDLYLRKEEVENACKHFQQAIDLYAQLGLHNNAVALCRKVMRLAPSRIEVRYSLARLRFDQGLRADGVAAFNDYLDNAPTQGEEAIAGLEERCRSLVDAFPDAAPVGKILEKLENVHAFQCAFEIVQRLAQRAADAGDDGAAAKYTEKMRSLKVLVAGSGGGDILSESHGPSPPPEAVTDFAASTSPPEIEIDADAAPRVIEIDTDTAPSLIEIDADTAPRVIEIEADAAPPEIEIDADAAPPVIEIDTDNVSATEATSTSDPPTPFDRDDVASGAAPQEREMPAVAPDRLPAEPIPAAAPAQVSASGTPTLDDLLQDLDAIEPDEVPSAPEPAPGEPFVSQAAADVNDGTLEYELPEASLEDIAEILEDEPPHVAPTETRASSPETPRAAPSMESHPVTPDPGFALGAARSQPAAPVASPDAAPSTPPSASSNLAPSTAAPTSARPSQQVPRPSQEQLRRSGSLPSGELRQPVWIPDPGADPTAMPDPSSGQMHQLEDVIETFRDQMAKALGNDAAARYDLGVAYYEMGLYNEALTEFEAAVQDAHYREQCLEMMAASLTMQGRHAEIVEMLTPLIEAGEADVGVGLRYTMGVACETLGLRDDARHHFEQVARIDSTYRDVQARLRQY